MSVFMITNNNIYLNMDDYYKNSEFFKKIENHYLDKPGKTHTRLKKIDSIITKILLTPN